MKCHINTVYRCNLEYVNICVYLSENELSEHLL